MRNAKPQPWTRTTITLPPDLHAFAAGCASRDHCGNLSAFLRRLLISARRNARKSPNHAAR